MINEGYGKDSEEGFHLLDDDNNNVNNNNTSNNRNSNSITTTNGNSNGRHHHHDLNLQHHHEEEGTNNNNNNEPSSSPFSSSSSLRQLLGRMGIEINCRSFWDEVHWLVWDLAIPQTLLQLGLMFSSAITAMYVGRTMGSLYLDGFTLGNLTGNLFVTSLLQGLFSASDTLSPQAFGAGNPRELGLLAIRGTVASFLIIVPIIAVLWTTLERIFMVLHQDDQVAKLATHWFQVFCLGLPSYSISMMMWRFLSAQNLMRPQLVVGITANFVVLPICLVLCTKWFGFVGSAAANAAFSTIHTIMLWLYLWYFQPHVPESWPGLCWREALEGEKIAQYIQLGLGGMLTYTEWVFWECLVLMTGTLGVIPLSVQTIANMVIEVCAMLPAGVGIAISIRIGNTISQNVKQAQQISLWSFLIGTVVFALLSILLYVLGPFVISLFTKETNVIEGCMSIWVKVCFLHWNVGIYGIVMGIATGLGMQWTLGIACLIILFGMGLPAAYYFAIFQGGGLQEIWFWINPPYLLLSMVMLIFFYKISWRNVAAEILQRQEISSDETIIGISSSSTSGASDGRTNDDDSSRGFGRAGYGSTDTEESLAQPLVPLASGREEQA